MRRGTEADGFTGRIIVTVHGIRTFGQWQERFAALISSEDPEARVYNYHYGFFSVLAFLIPPLRAIRVRSFRQTLQSIVQQNPEAKITLVGHSFGTHMIGWAITQGFEDKRLPFEQVILAGSVLRQDFDWQKLIDKRIIKRVINDCGIDDDILVLSQFGVLFTGMAGRLGFSGATGVSLFNRFHRGGHSHYFVDHEGQADDQFMAHKWIPLIMGTGKPDPFDSRATPGPVSGIFHWLIQNADGMKIAFLIAIAVFGWQQFYAGPRQAAEGERVAKLRVVAMQQLGNDESVPQGVATLLAIANRDPNDRDVLELATRWLPQLLDVGAVLKTRGSPAFAEWQGRNLLILPGKTITLPGDLVETYGFSRDGKLLLTFDAGGHVNVYATDSGKSLLSVPTWLPDKNILDQEIDDGRFDDDKGDGVNSDTSPYMRGTTVDEDYASAYAAGVAAAEKEEAIPDLKPVSEVVQMNFRESRDGKYLWGIGTTGATIAGDMRPAIILIDRNTMAYSFCAFNLMDALFFEKEGAVRFFAQAGYEGQLYEIAPPQKGIPCRYRNLDARGEPIATPAALEKQVKAIGMSDIPALAIAASAWKPPPDLSYVDSNEIGSPSIVFPFVLPSSSLWSTVPLPSGDPESLGFETNRQLRGTRMLREEEARIQRQRLRDYGATPKGKWVMDDIEYALGVGIVGGPDSDNPDRGTVVVSEAPSNILTLVEGGGIHFSSTIYCKSRKLGAPIDFCGSLNLNGDSTSVAISRGNRYIAGADFAVAYRAGIIIHDIANRRQLTVDRQPLGGTHSVAFDPTGTMVFAATPLGIYAYSLSGDGTAKFERLYQVAGLSARSGEEFIDAIIAVGSTQIYYLVPGGQLQAISRKTGDVDWLQEIARGGASITLDDASGQLAAFDSECVNLLQARTGARLTARYCPGSPIDPLPGEEAGDSIATVRFSDKHVAEVYNLETLHRFDRIKPLKPPAKKPTSLLSRFIAWLELGAKNPSEEEIAAWRNRTGHDVSELPATPLTELIAPSR